MPAREMQPHTTVLGWSALLMGAMGLTGWVLGIDALTRVLPGLETMKFNTAAAIALLGLAIAVPNRYCVRCAAGAAVGIMAVLTLFEYATAQRGWIDELVMADPDGGPNPGRMGINTAAALLAGATGVLAAGAGCRMLAQASAIGTIIIGWLGCLGYLYGVQSFYTVTAFSTMALNTSVAMLLVGFGVLALVPDGVLAWIARGDDPGAAMLRWLLPVTLLGLPVIGYIRLLGQREGWYTTEFGVAVMVLTASSVLTADVMVAARVVRRAHRARLSAMARVQQLNHELECRVGQRTADLVDSITREREIVRQLKASEQVRDRFVATVSHELRTPLTNVVGFLEMLAGGDAGPLTNGQVRALQVIGRNAERLRTLIEDLLTMAALDHNGAPDSRSTADLAAVVRGAAEACALGAERAGVDLVVELPSGTATVNGRADELERALVNLVGNAVKFTRPGGRVAVALTLDRTHGEIVVADNGIGIDAADLPRLFDPFFRTDSAITGAVPGTGLGLAITKGIVELHGGTVTAVSTIGAGTKFTIRLPLAGDPAAGLPGAALTGATGVPAVPGAVTGR